MKQVFGYVFLLWLFTSSFVASASAAVLADITYPLLGAVLPSGGYTGFKLYVEDGGTPYGGYQLFEDLVFPIGHTSGTYYADATSDPDFAAFAAKLMDGVNDPMIFWGEFYPAFPGCACGGGAGPVGEFSRFGGHDFLGSVVTRIALQIDSLDVSSAPGGPSSVFIDARFIVEGEPAAVPEPSSVTLLAGGLSLLGFLCRRA